MRVSAATLDNLPNASKMKDRTNEADQLIRTGVRKNIEKLFVEAIERNSAAGISSVEVNTFDTIEQSKKLNEGLKVITVHSLASKYSDEVAKELELKGYKVTKNNPASLIYLVSW